MTRLTSRFVRRKEASQARVCKEVKTAHSKANNPIPESSKHKHHKIAFCIPDEYAFALMEMYGGGLQKSLMKHIRATVNPMIMNTCRSCEKGLCPDGKGGYIPCTICGRVG